MLSLLSTDHIILACGDLIARFPKGLLSPKIRSKYELVERVDFSIYNCHKDAINAYVSYLIDETIKECRDGVCFSDLFNEYMMKEYEEKIHLLNSIAHICSILDDKEIGINIINLTISSYKESDLKYEEMVVEIILLLARFSWVDIIYGESIISNIYYNKLFIKTYTDALYNTKKYQIHKYTLFDILNNWDVEIEQDFLIYKDYCYWNTKK